ncbi:rotatin [Fopius arisanus]|uniref:Rotatin n=1 Tax=Fopius arisanus TaxID=64838 RepID=A0A9R1U6F8_9HYME|nr:PREDICTED: rotatin [Fopius arisanus]
MTNTNAITSLHVKKLGHKIEEIRCRALENIISKLEHGFTCDCPGVKRELLSKLLSWFNFETAPHPEKVLDLMHYLISEGIVTPFEDSRVRNDLELLHSRLSPSHHPKLQEISNCLRLSPVSPRIPPGVPPSPEPSPPADETQVPSSPGTPISKRSENSIRWLLLPWQPLVSSDRGVLAAVEDALSKDESNLTIHTCQLITNVMLQDFPAEVFLQRPSIISIFHNFLMTSVDEKILRTILRALHKLTRSLRFRIYYYSDPCVANRRQRTQVPEDDEETDESVLQLQQMLLPTYCIETLSRTLRLLENQVDAVRPLETVKSMMDVSWELVELLKTSLTPSVWLSVDGLSLKIHEDLKSLLKLLGDILEFLRGYSNIDYWRITYLTLLSTTTKLLSSLVPLEVSDCVLPGSLKISLAVALMDTPVYLLHPGLHSTLLEYARQFRGDEVEYLRIFEETRIITRSLRAAVSVIKSKDDDIVRNMYLSRTSLECHGNLSIIERYMSILQGYNGLNSEDKSLSSKLFLHLLSHGNDNIRIKTYDECRYLVAAALGVERTRGRASVTWTSIGFLFDKDVLREIICHGVADDLVKSSAEDILIFLLKGKIPMGETGWNSLLEALRPVFPLLQVLGGAKSPLERCISKMLDPDLYQEISLTYLEVLKGNMRLLFSLDASLREESVFRLIYLLGMERNSTEKHPRLSSLHGLPLSSLLILERQSNFKKPEGNYDRCNLLSVLEMLKVSSVEPKVRKSALIQVSVMLTDSSLHRVFLKEKGLEILLEILERSLMEKDFENYPDSVVPIVTILRILSSTQGTVRHQLNDTNVLINILRGLFLFPNHETVKIDTAQLLFLLLFHDEIVIDVGISVPEVVITRMRVPFHCKIHWRTSPHRKEKPIAWRNPLTLAFVRQFWSWEWNNREDVLWTHWDSLNTETIDESLKISEQELSTLQSTSIRFSIQRQLFNIKNSTTHEEVTSALDYLWMYTRLTELNPTERSLVGLSSMPWEQSLERFLLSHPTSQDDCCLFVDVLNYLNLLMTITRDPGVIQWISRTTRHMTKSLSDLLRCLEKNYQNVHQSVLRLVRTCINLETDLDEDDSLEDFVEIIVSNLCSNDQQHFYNLAYLDWLLNCLTYLTSNKKWRIIQGNNNLVTTLVNSLMELIASFHGNGATSFMGLSITKNSIICLNHLLSQTTSKSFSILWRAITWLPTLWSNRDPLVRASGLQLLGGLLRTPHDGQELLQSLGMAPNELLQGVIKIMIDREEASIVREKAAVALSHLVKNSRGSVFNYCDSLRPNAIVIYLEQANVFYEMSIMCSNLYLSGSLESEGAAGDSDTSRSYPRSVLHFYNGQDETSLKDDSEFVTTPALVTAVCCLINNLVIIGGDVITKIYENSLDKYLVSCLGPIPTGPLAPDVLQMYVGICTVLTNCISHSGEFANSVNFSPDFLFLLMSYLNEERIGKRLMVEVFNLLSVMSLTEGQHLEAIRTAVDVLGVENLVLSICRGVGGDGEVRMSAIACLGFLLGIGIEGKDLLAEALDDIDVENVKAGARICQVLVELLVAYNYAKKRISRDKELVMGTLANLLCVSREAKDEAERQNLGMTSVMILKELFTEISLQPHHKRGEREKKMAPVIGEVAKVLGLLMNFSCGSCRVKRNLAAAGVADVLHKLWAWICLNDAAIISALKMLATLTTDCPEAAQSLTLTTTLPGSGPRRTPNTVSLLNVIIHLITQEVDKASQSFDNHRLHFAFHVLRNSVHVHECRVAISKSNLLQFFTKIHPLTTKRNKPWPLIEIYCLEFLIDFTFYDEGQTCVPKTTDGFEVLIQLSKCSSSSQRILSLSILRNLVFNVINRPRILASIEFMNLLHWVLRRGSFCEIGVVGSILWALVTNNQKAKLIARTAGFAQALQEVLGRIALDNVPHQLQQDDLVRMIQYVIKIIKTSDAKCDLQD